MSMSILKCKSCYLFRQVILWLGCFVCLLGLIGCGDSNVVSLPTPTPTFSLTPTLTPTQTPTQTPTFAPTATEPPAFCGGPRVMYILLVGSDSRSNGYIIGLADSINVVRVDFVEPRIQLLTFQRDLYVEIPGIANHNVTMGKLNQAFLYGNPGYGYYAGVGQGPGLLAATLKHNFGTQVDYYVAVNMQSFVKIVDALGGIDIDLPEVVNGRVPGSRDPDRYFPSGKQHLNGYRSMLLARMRPMGVFRRSAVQSLIMQALAKKLFVLPTIRKIPDLIETFYGSVQTDLGVAEMSQLTCLAGKLDAQKIEFVNFPEGLFESGRVSDPVLGYTSILKVDFEVLRKYVQAFNKGIWLESQEALDVGLPMP